MGDVDGSRDSASDEGRQKRDHPKAAFENSLAHKGFILGTGHSPHHQSSFISAADASRKQPIRDLTLTLEGFLSLFVTQIISTFL